MHFPALIEIRPSRRILFLQAALHGLAAAALLFGPQGAWAGVFLPVLGLSWWRGIRRHADAPSWRLRLHDTGALEVCEPGQAWYAARLSASTTDFGVALWLHWRRCDEAGVPCPEGARALMLCPDALSFSGWRTLRAWMRWLAITGMAVSDR